MTDPNYNPVDYVANTIWQEALNEAILARDDINIKRFLGIDSAVYREGALPAKTKELLGAGTREAFMEWQTIGANRPLPGLLNH